MLHIGCHLSSSGGYEAMVRTAIEIGADTFQFFTRNPRGSKAKPVDEEDVKRAAALMFEHNFAPAVAHAPYTLNPASSRPEVREFAYDIFKDDLRILQFLGGNYYNFHPGSHLGDGVQTGIERTVEILNGVLFENMKTTVLIETMAGKGSEIGATFSEIKDILDGVNLKSKVGVCLDSCHVSDGGYDVISDFSSVLDEFDRIIGIDKLYAIHLNDSKNPQGAKKDRHEKIGDGYIGIESIKKIINEPRLKGLPFILETPNELDGYEKEIALLKGLYTLS